MHREMQRTDLRNSRMVYKLPFWSFFLFAMITSLGCAKESEPLFSLISPSESNVDFENTIHDDDTLNILNFEYIYNGGGVGIGDFDKDGLADLFFTGNMVDNQLYFNKGDFKFDAAPSECGISGTGFWCSGIAVADFNYDGWDDLFVATTTSSDPRLRQNLLFINEGLNEAGIPTFTEKAGEYGLADTNYCVTPVLIDYDNDLDLDVFIIVNKILDDRISPVQYRKKQNQGDFARIDKLYRNDFDSSLNHPVFTDVSSESGITIPGFSLGVSVCDINMDGWMDIYISNDFISNDVLYINQQDGTFEDRIGDYFKHSSHSAMGNDFADLNNDGLGDLFVLDMLPEDNFRRKTMLSPINYMSYINNEEYGYDYQFVRNTLQYNQGRNPIGNGYVFSDIAFYAGVSATDWSWCPLMADFDNDGFRDIIITNGFPRDITDRDFMDYHANAHRFFSDSILLKQIPEVRLHNYAYRNNGDMTFEDKTMVWGLDQPSFSNGAIYADLDKDGDLDIVVNNINGPASLYRNNLSDLDSNQYNYIRIDLNGPIYNHDALGSKVKVFYKDEIFYHAQSPYRGYLSTIESAIHIGLPVAIESIDSLLIIWPDGSKKVILNVTPGQTLEVMWSDPQKFSGLVVKDEADRLYSDLTHRLDSAFLHRELDFIDFNIQPLLPHKLSQYGPGISVGKINGDDLFDFYVGGSHDFFGKIFIQGSDGVFTGEDLGDSDRERRSEDQGSLFFDADNDGDEDLYIVTGGYEYDPDDPYYHDKFYLNEDGELNLSSVIPEFKSSGSCVRASDFDQDGDLDLFVGGRILPHKYPEPVNSYILLNTLDQGSLGFEIANQEVAPSLDKLGLVTDAIWSDFNSDGWMDLIVVGEWMPVTFFQNNNGKLKKVSHKNDISSRKGWWNSISAGDYDHDGDIDYLAGNFGSNTLFDVSNDHPIRVYGKDFDHNGGYDAIITVYFKDEERSYQEFPLHGRTDFVKQLLFAKDKFTLHKDYARATIFDLLTKEQMDSALVLEANYFNTSIIRNNGDDFEMMALPMEAQIAPIYGTGFQDVNFDGQTDMVLVGNDYGMDLLTGRCDAFNGLVMLGSESGDLDPLAIEKSGFYVPGDAKGSAQLISGDTLLTLVGQNRGPLKIFGAKINSNYKVVDLEPLDCFVEYQHNNTQHRLEVYHGSGFLSQSQRSVIVPIEAGGIEITDSQNKVRRIEF